MNTRPIPSTGEALPVIGCGTYVGFDTRRETASTHCFPAWSARFSTPAARCSTARRCTAAPRRRPASCSRQRPSRRGVPRHQGLDPRPRGRRRQMEASMRLLRAEPHRPDADPQPARLAHPPRDLARRGRTPAGSATSASPTTRRRRTPRSRRCCARRSSTSSRSTTRSTSARPSSASCRSPPSAASRSSSTCRSAAVACCADCAPSRCRHGLPRSAARAGRSCFSSSS